MKLSVQERAEFIVKGVGDNYNPMLFPQIQLDPETADALATALVDLAGKDAKLAAKVANRVSVLIDEGKLVGSDEYESIGLTILNPLIEKLASMGVKNLPATYEPSGLL